MNSGTPYATRSNLVSRALANPKFTATVFPDSQGKAKKVVQAQKLWFAVLEAQIETGNPYILFKVPYFSFMYTVSTLDRCRLHASRP